MLRSRSLVRFRIDRRGFLDVARGAGRDAHQPVDDVAVKLQQPPTVAAGHRMGHQDDRSAEAADEGAESLHHGGAVEPIERNVAAAAGARPVRHHAAVAAFGEEIGPSAPAVGGELIAGAGVGAAVDHDDGGTVGRGRRCERLEINRHWRGDQTGLVDHRHGGNSTAGREALRADTLVFRFRRSYHFAAPTFTNVGNKGTLASHDPSVPIPKFAHPRGPLRCELRNQRDTSNFMILVRHLDLKFLNELAAIMIGTSNPPH